VICEIGAVAPILEKPSVVREEEIAERRKELGRQLGEDVHNLDRLSTALNQLQGQTAVGPYAALLLALTGVGYEEEEAHGHWQAVLDRRREMEATLGRPVAVRVALLDYLTEQNSRSVSPNLIDLRVQSSPARANGIDPVTGLLDPEALTSHLQREVQRAKRFRTGFSVLLAEVDDFNALVRQVGDANGGLIQREVGLLLRNAVRDIDLAAHIGAARFAVVMPETDRTGAFLVADRLRERVEKHFAERAFAARRVPVTVSGGIACYPEDASYGAEVMQRAAQALHHAHARGSDRITVHFRDRREFIRIEVDPEQLRIDVVERGEPGADAATAQIAHNISPQGVLAFAVDREVSVICNNLRKIDQVILPARVVRVEVLEEELGGMRYEIGLAFELNWEHQVREIMEFLERYRAPDVS